MLLTQRYRLVRNVKRRLTKIIFPIRCGFGLTNCHPTCKTAKQNLKQILIVQRIAGLKVIGGTGTYCIFFTIALLMLWSHIASAVEKNKDDCISFNIPPTNAAEAINLFAKQTGAKFLFPFDLAQARQSNPLRGCYTQEQALNILLHGSGLSSGLSDKGIIIISLASNKAFDTSTNQRKDKMKTKKSLLAVMIGFFAGQGTVHAQGTDVPSMTLEEVVVTGTRAQNRAAIAIKSSNHQIMDAIGGDEAGKLPDVNIADVFRRLPGVTTLLNNDEGRYVAVRGLEPGLNYVTIDGMSVGSEEENGRKVNMETIPAGAVSSLEVFKTQMPEFDGNAIGGTLNLVTRSAYDSAEPYFKIDGNLTKYTFDETPGDNSISGSFNVAYGATFGADDQFGVVLSVGGDKKDRDAASTVTRHDYTTDADLNVTQSVLRQSYTRQRASVWERKNYSAKFEYKPNENLYTYFHQFYYALEEDQEFYLNKIQKSGDYDAVTNTVSGGVAASEITAQTEDRSTSGSHFHVDYFLNDMNKFSVDAAKSDVSFERDNLTHIFETGNDDKAALAYTIDNSDFYPNPVVSDPSVLLDPSNFIYKRAQAETKKQDETIDEVKFDYGYNTEAGAVGWGARAGLKYRETSRDFDRTRQRFTWGGDDDLTMAGLTDQTIITPFRPVVPQIYPNIETTGAFFNNNFDQFTPDEGDNITSSTGNDFKFTEEVTAVYFGSQYIADSFSVFAGLRYEETEVTSEGTEENKDVDKTDPNRFVTTSNKGDYNDVLPSLSANYYITDQLVLRGALSRSIGRADPGDIKARNSIDEDPGKGIVKISQGNPDLKPRRSDNIDVSLEYYFDEGDGLLALALFHKNLKDYIISTTTDIGIRPEDGYIIQLTEKQNANDAEVTGVEIGFVKNTLDFLPEAFHGLGVSGNLTWLDAELTYFNSTLNREVTVDHLLNQTDFMANFSVFYNFLDRGEIRLAYNHQAAYSSGLKTNGKDYEERIVQETDIVDLQIRYDVSDNLTLTAKAKNLTDQEKETYVNFDTEPQFRDEFGRSYWIGASYTF
jgi:iron complex outermembrane recepter protein